MRPGALKRGAGRRTNGAAEERSGEEPSPKMCRVVAEFAFTWQFAHFAGVFLAYICQKNACEMIKTALGRALDCHKQPTLGCSVVSWTPAVGEHWPSSEVKG